LLGAPEIALVAVLIGRDAGGTMVLFPLSGPGTGEITADNGGSTGRRRWGSRIGAPLRTNRISRISSRASGSAAHGIAAEARELHAKRGARELGLKRRETVGPYAVTSRGLV
jgi:hypothetical protein